jgi:hypothetical protein
MKLREVIAELAEDLHGFLEWDIGEEGGDDGTEAVGAGEVSGGVKSVSPEQVRQRGQITIQERDVDGEGGLQRNRALTPLTVLADKKLRDFHQRNRGRSGISFSTASSDNATFLNSDPTPIATLARSLS